MNITIVGASSGTGEELARAALTRGHAVTAISRSGNVPEGVRAVTGDATDPAVARRAVDGADAVFVTVGGSTGTPTPRTAVTRSVVAAMQEAGARRLVVQTSLGAGGSARQLPWPQRVLAPRILAGPLADHDAQEDLVRASGLEWTIVRPAGLTNGSATGAWRALRSTEPGRVKGRISRADVAGYLLHCLDDPATVGAEIGLSQD